MVTLDAKHNNKRWDPPSSLYAATGGSDVGSDSQYNKGKVFFILHAALIADMQTRVQMNRPIIALVSFDELSNIRDSISISRGLRCPYKPDQIGVPMPLYIRSLTIERRLHDFPVRLTP